MASLTQHTMINKWDDDINEAITSVGGDTYGSSGLPDYPEIIKTQLVSNEAVGKGIYQDFLYVDDKNQTSSYPWEGEPTNSTNAVQAGVLADSIKQLFDIMASTERFKVYLVDELPKGEIDLSAVFIVPIIYKLLGTAKKSPEGRVTDISFNSPHRLSSSIRVISSPSTLEIFPRLISSIIIT